MATASVASSAPARGLEVRRLGRLDYAKAFALQQELRDLQLAGRGRDTLLLLEHPDVITFGRGARSESARFCDDELREQGYAVFRTNRGGDVTYHGPGQLIGYPILDLRHHGRDVHAYLRALEAALIATLADFGIEGTQRGGFAGVWLDSCHKIASIGVGVRRWVTMHGFALNVCCDLERFGAIVPCGLAGVEMVSMESVLGQPVDLPAVLDCVAQHLARRFA